jgi:hypothetical protein
LLKHDFGPFIVATGYANLFYGKDLIAVRAVRR